MEDVEESNHKLELIKIRLKFCRSANATAFEI